MGQRITEQPKKCERCGVLMTRRRMPSGTLEDMGSWNRRRFCSLSCANSRPHSTKKQTYLWRARKLIGSECAACGRKTRLQAHHIDGDQSHNQPENIQTLCITCHRYLHATASRLGWTVPGKLASPALLPE
jgi:hypothetical protein